jgi:ribosomal protein L40E
VSGSPSPKTNEIFICPLCQVENRATAKFCRRCGKTRAELDLVAKGDDLNPEATPSNPVAPVAKQAGEKLEGAEVVSKDSLPFIYAGPPRLINPVVAEEVPGDSGNEDSQGIEDFPSVPVQTAAADVRPSAADIQGSEADLQPSEAQDLVVQHNLGGQVQDYVSPECPSCHTGLRVTDKFCSWCGESQPNRLYPDLRVCPGCDQRLPYRANYCFSCGRDVGVHPRIAMRMPTELFKEEDSEFFPTFEA